jgi:hypothetical protein
MRVDLFSTIHKGVRAMLFELSHTAARTDINSTPAIDELFGHVDRVLSLLDEHAKLEDEFIFPVVRSLDPSLADELAADHRGLHAVQREVELAAEALALTDLSQRPTAGAQLVRVVNHMIAVQLLHMNREETEVNATLWAGLSDVDLGAIRARVTRSIPSERMALWLAILQPAVNPVERLQLAGPRAA